MSEEKPFEITVFVSTEEDGCECTDTVSLREFLEANADGLSDKEKADLLMHLARGETYKGGGGAALAFKVELADPVEHDRAMRGHDDLVESLKATEKLAQELMQRFNTADRLAMKAGGIERPELEMEAGEVTRMRSQLSLNRKAIEVAEGRS